MNLKLAESAWAIVESHRWVNESCQIDAVLTACRLAECETAGDHDGVAIAFDRLHLILGREQRFALSSHVSVPVRHK